MTSQYITEAPLEQHDYSLPGFETTDGGFILYVRLRSVWLYIHVLAHNFHHSPLAIEALHQNTAELSSDEAPWDYLGEIASHFLSELRKLAPAIHHVGKLTLADLQDRQYYTCELEFHNEMPRPSPITPRDPSEPGITDDWYDPEVLPFETSFPCFQPCDVEVAFDNPTTIYEVPPEKVFVQGTLYFWKPTWTVEESIEAVRKYGKMVNSGIPPNQLLTSRLFGVVVDSKGRPHGQLYHWLDIDQPMSCELIEQAPKDVREKWALQIQNTVSTLHGIDVIWGDVKADNVVIDKSGNAIVIDFEGGVTRGWVDEEKMGTKEGDLQGLERLVEYILDENCPLRLREREFLSDIGQCGSDC